MRSMLIFFRHDRTRPDRGHVSNEPKPPNKKHQKTGTSRGDPGGPRNHQKIEIRHFPMIAVQHSAVSEWRYFAHAHPPERRAFGGAHMRKNLTKP